MKHDAMDAFLDQLASSAPTPGGGSVAALMGAMGAALVSMVCNLTIGKQNYVAVEAEMQSTLESAETLRRKLVVAIQHDIDAFDAVMAAYGLPKASEEQVVTRSRAIQSALTAATEAPMQCAHLCLEVIALSETVAHKGNRNILSDAGVAAVAANAALKSSALNVHVNAKLLKDSAFADARLLEIQSLLEAGEAASNRIFTWVKANL